MTPDLARIAQALRTTADSFEFVRRHVEFPSEVWTRDANPKRVARGKPSECLAYIDARCAEAAVRAMTPLSQPSDLWRVGSHYGIHVYAGERPVATFHHAEDAQCAVAAVNAAILTETKP